MDFVSTVPFSSTSSVSTITAPCPFHPTSSITTTSTTSTDGLCFPTFEPPKPLPTVIITETETEIETINVFGGVTDDLTETDTVTATTNTAITSLGDELTHTLTLTDTAATTTTTTNSPAVSTWTVTKTVHDHAPVAKPCTRLPDIFYSQGNPYHTRFPKTIQKIVEEDITKSKQRAHRTFVKNAVQIVPTPSSASAAAVAEPSSRRTRLRAKLAQRAKK